MPKKYIVRLTDEERQILGELVGKLKGTSQKVRRAQVLLKADAGGPGWTDARIAEAFDCRTQTAGTSLSKSVDGFTRQHARLQGHSSLRWNEKTTHLQDWNESQPRR